jgi:hypothetical protein
MTPHIGFHVHCSSRDSIPPSVVCPHLLRGSTLAPEVEGHRHIHSVVPSPERRRRQRAENMTPRRRVRLCHMEHSELCCDRLVRRLFQPRNRSRILLRRFGPKLRLMTRSRRLVVGPLGRRSRVVADEEIGEMVKRRKNRMYESVGKMETVCVLLMLNALSRRPPQDF